jgi:hypothetical protein
MGPLIFVTVPCVGCLQFWASNLELQPTSNGVAEHQSYKQQVGCY